jgi:hypothetical protein
MTSTFRLILSRLPHQTIAPSAEIHLYQGLTDVCSQLAQTQPKKREKLETNSAIVRKSPHHNKHSGC